MPRKKSGNEGSDASIEVPQGKPLTVTYSVGKRQYKRLMEIGKPFGMTADEAAKEIMMRHMG